MLLRFLFLQYKCKEIWVSAEYRGENEKEKKLPGICAEVAHVGPFLCILLKKKVDF